MDSGCYRSRPEAIGWGDVNKCISLSTNSNIRLYSVSVKTGSIRFSIFFYWWVRRTQIDVCCLRICYLKLELEVCSQSHRNRVLIRSHACNSHDLGEANVEIYLHKKFTQSQIVPSISVHYIFVTPGERRSFYLKWLLLVFLKMKYASSHLSCCLLEVVKELKLIKFWPRVSIVYPN